MNLTASLSGQIMSQHFDRNPEQRMVYEFAINTPSDFIVTAFWFDDKLYTVCACHNLLLALSRAHAAIALMKPCRNMVHTISKIHDDLRSIMETQHRMANRPKGMFNPCGHFSQ